MSRFRTTGSNSSTVVERSDRSRILSVAIFVIVVCVWEGAVRGFHISPVLIPSPSSTLVAMYRGVIDGSIVTNLGVTVYETLAGFFVGSFLGLILGGIIGQSNLVERVFYPYVIAFQTVPKVAVAPLIVVWFGYGVTSKVVITATIAFFPVLANTIAGLRSASRDQIDLIVAFDGTRWQAFKYIKLPNALPYIFVGLDVAIVLAVIGAIVGEFVGSQAGLGYLILQRNFSLDTAGVFSILIVLSMMGVGMHACVQAIRKRVVFWVSHQADSVSGV